MYIRRSVQSEDFILLKRQESFNYDSSDTSLPDLSANSPKPTGEDNGVTLGIVRFCIVLGGILFVIIITGIITYIYRKKLSKLKQQKKSPIESSINHILDYYEHDYVKPSNNNGITVVRVNKSNISIPTSNEDIRSLPITTSQISAPMPNASVSIFNKERANSLARSVENLNTTIAPPVPALTSINQKDPKTISRNTSKGSEMLGPTPRESEMFKYTLKGSEKLSSTSRGSEMLKSTSRGSEALRYTSRGSETLRYISRGSETLRYTSRGSEVKTLSDATSFDNILPEIFDDSTENTAPIDINAKWFTYPIDSPTIPLTPSRVPKGFGSNDEQSSSDESVINDIPEVYDRKSKRNLRIRIDTFDQFNNLTGNKPSYTPSATFTPKSAELKENEGVGGNKSPKVDTNKIVQELRGSDKYKSFGSSSKNNQHKRNGNIFEHKYLIRSKTIT